MMPVVSVWWVTRCPTHHAVVWCGELVIPEAVVYGESAMIYRETTINHPMHVRIAQVLQEMINKLLVLSLHGFFSLRPKLTHWMLAAAAAVLADGMNGWLPIHGAAEHARNLAASFGHEWCVRALAVFVRLGLGCKYLPICVRPFAQQETYRYRERKNMENVCIRGVNFFKSLFEFIKKCTTVYAV